MNKNLDEHLISLDYIVQRKKILLQEIRSKKKIMADLAEEILAPLEPAPNKLSAWMRSINTGMALWDGLVWGWKSIKKIRSIVREE